MAEKEIKGQNSGITQNKKKNILLLIVLKNILLLLLLLFYIINIFSYKESEIINKY